MTLCIQPRRVARGASHDAANQSTCQWARSRKTIRACAPNGSQPFILTSLKHRLEEESGRPPDVIRWTAEVCSNARNPRRRPGSSRPSQKDKVVSFLRSSTQPRTRSCDHDKRVFRTMVPVGMERALVRGPSVGLSPDSRTVHPTCRPLLPGPNRLTLALPP